MDLEVYYTPLPYVTAKTKTVPTVSKQGIDGIFGQFDTVRVKMSAPRPDRVAVKKEEAALMIPSGIRTHLMERLGGAKRVLFNAFEIVEPTTGKTKKVPKPTPKGLYNLVKSNTWTKNIFTGKHEEVNADYREPVVVRIKGEEKLVNVSQLQRDKQLLATQAVSEKYPGKRVARAKSNPFTGNPERPIVKTKSPIGRDVQYVGYMSGYVQLDSGQQMAFESIGFSEKRHDPQTQRMIAQENAKRAFNGKVRDWMYGETGHGSDDITQEEMQRFRIKDVVYTSMDTDGPSGYIERLPSIEDERGPYAY